MQPYEFYYLHEWSHFWNRFRGHRRKVEKELLFQRQILGALYNKPGEEIMPFSIDEATQNKHDYMTDEDREEMFQDLAKRYNLKLPDNPKIPDG